MTTHPTLQHLAGSIKDWGRQLGFQQIGICAPDLGLAESRWQAWLDQGRQGDMHYMAAHGSRRARPAELIPGTLRVISARVDYLPEPQERLWRRLREPDQAYLAAYALGRDYHRLLRRRLQALAERAAAVAPGHQWRAFVDSAPVLEKPLAQQAGLGWLGKHTNLIHPQAGSWFFLGELYTDLALPVDAPMASHCGRCDACLRACPTGAIVAPYQLDARLCISYLTIESRGAIPEPLRPLIGNRVFGCDDCQLVCPWNRFACLTQDQAFAPRRDLSEASLVELFGWSESQFLDRCAGSPLRRVGYVGWLRNLAVALGNAPPDGKVQQALEQRQQHPEPLVREHVAWALARQRRRGGSRFGADERVEPD